MAVWTRCLLVGLGGALGANARYWLGLWITERWGSSLPWATLAINVSGSCILGFVATVLPRTTARPGVAEGLLLLVGVGVLGGYTTFSTFSLEVHRLLRAGELARAGAYVASSLLGGVTAAGAGAAMAAAIFRTPPA